MEEKQFAKTLNVNGYRPRSWGDIVAIATLMALFVGVLSWGLKLEARIDTITDRQIDISRQVGEGILPRAEERIRHLEKRMESHEQQEHGR